MRSLLVGTLVLSALAAAPTHAQQPVAYVVKLGGDTLSLEQFTVTSQQVRGELVVRTPRSLYRRYTMDLHPDGLQVATAHYDKHVRITRLAAD